MLIWVGIDQQLTFLPADDDALRGFWVGQVEFFVSKAELSDACRADLAAACGAWRSKHGLALGQDVARVEVGQLPSESPSTSSPNLNLPQDLANFLQAGRSLDYNAAECEAGLVTLVEWASLKLERFPVDTQSTPLEEADPRRGDLGCYLVPAVNLTKEAEGYDGTGLLLWLPEHQRYGTWDSSHPFLAAFPKATTWTDIAAHPLMYINAQWEGAFEDAAESEPLVPWPEHPYSAEQCYEPRPA